MAIQAGAVPGAPDPVRVDSGHYTVEIENDKVRVLRIRYAPHERSVMHSHPASVIVMLTDGRMRFTFPDGSVEEVEAKAGQTMTFPAIDHLPENLGETALEAVAIELKA